MKSFGITTSVKLARRTCWLATAAILASVLATGFASAQDKFPSKTIEVVTHAGAGGGTDITTRMTLLCARGACTTDRAEDKPKSAARHRKQRARRARGRPGRQGAGTAPPVMGAG